MEECASVNDSPWVVHCQAVDRWYGATEHTPYPLYFITEYHRYYTIHVLAYKCFG